MESETLNSFNSVDEIKSRLLLEDEDQTISNEIIENYLEEANEELFDSIKRNHEKDIFYYEEDRFNLWFPAVSILSVYADGVLLDDGDYELVDNNSAVKIEGLESGTKIEINYIPAIYKLYERAICIVNLMTRLNPMITEQPSTVYLNWSNKKKEYKSTLKSRFGVTSYED